MSSLIDSVNGSVSPLQTLSTITNSESANASSFQDILNTMLKPDQQGQVNEEQLFAAIINERLTTQVGEDSANAYRDLFATYQQELQRADGFIPIEQAAEKALNGIIDQGLLSREEAEKLQAQAFTAAQIDDNDNYLYDSRGSSVAVTLVNLAIQSAEEEMEAIETGVVTPSSSSLNSGTTGEAANTQGTFVGGDGFLYKPVSESNGNLVILLPAHMRDDVESVELLDSAGNSIERGDSYGNYDDSRPIFRFNHAGAAYPDNLTVRIKLDTGDYKQYTIPDSSRRWE